MSTIDSKQLISHHASEESIEDVMNKIAKRIQGQGDKPQISVKQQLDLLQQLSTFDFGRFLLKNQGINGYWTHYMLMHPFRSLKNDIQGEQRTLTELEQFILEKAPTMLATQQRFKIFLQENQEKVAEKAQLACIPCGMMGELLYLDYHLVQNIHLVGFDYDGETLKDAHELAKKRSLLPFVELHQLNAWDLNISNRFDLISSNGLTIYEPNDKKVLALYGLFHQALKEGGKLVTSFLTPPPTLSEHCEWEMSQIDENALLLQKILFADIINAKWQCFRSTEQTRSQLESVGFRQIRFIYDKAHLFPTVVAYK